MQLSSLRKRLGDILVDVGIITPAQLKEALDIQKRNGGKLGTILSQMGALNEEVMVAFLGKQCGVSYISLAEYGEIPADIINAVPESVVRHQMLVPIAKEHATLTVAMADPFNVFAVDDIKVMTGYDVNVVIASESEIRAAISKYYSHLSEPAAGPQAAASDKTLVPSLVREALAMNASDILIEPHAGGIRARHKIDGVLYEKITLPQDRYKTLITQLKTLAGLNSEEQRLPQDGHLRMTLDEREVSLRVSFVPTVLGETTVIQLLNPHVSCMDFSKLGFDPETLAVYKSRIETPGGLILIAGPIGSGKTTTLYSTLSLLNFPEKSIVTIEGHVECFLPGITQIRIQPEIGFTFASGLRAAMRQNPEIVMVGELLDRETAQLAATTALNGHTVFSTLSAAGTIETITHLLTMGIEPFLITSTSPMIVAQRLIRIICPQCRESYQISKNHLHGIGIDPAGVKEDTLTLWRGKGCPACARTGYSGRTALYELLMLDEKLCSLVLERAPESVLREAALAQGLLTLRDAAWRKVRSGVSTVEEMLRITKQSKIA